MAVRTVGDSSLPRREPAFQILMLPSGTGQEMLGVDAPWVLAPVVDLIPWGDAGDQQFIREAMGEAARIELEYTIPMEVLSAGPIPTASPGIDFDFEPKAVQGMAMAATAAVAASASSDPRRGAVDRR